jgi:hypothetical protein
MAGLLARGSPPCVAFPVAQWHDDAWLAAHSCGGSRSFGFEIPLLRSLLIPEGNHRNNHASARYRASMRRSSAAKARSVELDPTQASPRRHGVRRGGKQEVSAACPRCVLRQAPDARQPRMRWVEVLHQQERSCSTQLFLILRKRRAAGRSCVLRLLALIPSFVEGRSRSGRGYFVDGIKKILILSLARSAMSKTHVSDPAVSRINSQAL